MPLNETAIRALCKEALLDAFELMVLDVSEQTLAAVYATLRRVEMCDPLMANALRGNYLLNDLWNLIIAEREKRLAFLQLPQLPFEGKIS